MKETRFVSQNKEKWLESETLLTNPIKDPEKLSNLFTQVVDDLSYSRTYYPNRSVRVYLNKIARQYFSIIYSHKKEKRNRFKLFWLDELPQIIIYSRKQLVFSLIIFLISTAIGIFSSYKDPEFAATILGKDYVSMTQENISKGDPMAVYKKSHQVDMFLGITFNNLFVAFRIYVLGVFLSIGTVAILMYNGIMVGCFQFFFIERGLFLESALSIWLHGTLEISSIILAGGAGLTLGSGLIFPGTYSRLQAFQLSAIRSLKLMVGITPVFVLAAIIESFLTRYTDVPDAVKLVIIILSAAFIIGYFIVYPWLKSRSGFEVPLVEVRLPPQIKETISYTRVKNNGEILKDTFLFYSRNVRKLLPWVVAVSLFSTTVFFFLGQQEEFIVFEKEWWQILFSNLTFAMITNTPWSILINTISASVILYRVMKLLDGAASKTKFKLDIQAFIQLFLITAVMYAAIYLGGWGIFGLVCTFGLMLLMAFTQLTEKSGLPYGVAKGWQLFFANIRLAGELQIMLLFLSFTFLLVLSAPLIWMYTSILQWNFAETDTWSNDIIRFLEVFIKTCLFYMILPVMAACTGYLYFTLEEINTANCLKESILRFGNRGLKGFRR
ncbi:MAG: stage II sporulation protein M [Chryseolinea sp.]